MNKKFSIVSTLILSLLTTSAFAESNETNAAEETAIEQAVERAIIEQTAQATYRLPENSNRSPFLFGYFDTGLILGSIGRFEERGVLVNSWEFDVNVGDAGKQSIYSGPSDTFYSMPFAYSTLNKDMYNELGIKTPLNTPVVFKYRWNLINFGIRKETRYNIVDSYATYIGLSPAAANLPLQWSTNKRMFFKRKKNVRSVGRIIKVQRSGRLWTGCLITLHKKGYEKIVHTKEEANGNAEFRNYKQTGSLGSNSASYVDTTMNVERYVINEDGCRYAEALMPFGSIVEIVSDHAYTSIFNYREEITAINVQ